MSDIKDKDREAIVKANKELAFDLKEDQHNIYKKEAKAAKNDAKNIKNEYELTEKIIERTIQINGNLRNDLRNNVFVYHNIWESGPQGVEKIVAAHLEPYLNTLYKKVNNKGLNKEVINIFKENMEELTKESSHLYDKREEISSSFKKEDTAVDTALNKKIKESKGQKAGKSLEKIAEKLSAADQVELTNITKALKDTGMLNARVPAHVTLSNKKARDQSRHK